MTSLTKESLLGVLLPVVGIPAASLGGSTLIDHFYTNKNPVVPRHIGSEKVPQIISGLSSGKFDLKAIAIGADGKETHIPFEKFDFRMLNATGAHTVNFVLSEKGKNGECRIKTGLENAEKLISSAIRLADNPKPKFEASTEIMQICQNIRPINVEVHGSFGPILTGFASSILSPDKKVDTASIELGQLASRISHRL